MCMGTKNVHKGSLAHYGIEWPCIALCGLVWLYMALSGLVRPFLPYNASYGLTWSYYSYMAFYGKT